MHNNSRYISIIRSYPENQNVKSELQNIHRCTYPESTIFYYFRLWNFGVLVKILRRIIIYKNKTVSKKAANINCVQ